MLFQFDGKGVDSTGLRLKIIRQTIKDPIYENNSDYFCSLAKNNPMTVFTLGLDTISLPFFVLTS